LSGDDRSKGLDRAEKAARAAIKLSQTPTIEMFFRLGDTLEDEGKYQEAETALHNVLTRADKTSDLYFGAVRNMILCAAGLNHSDDEKLWFNELERRGQATSYDWHSHAERLSFSADYKAAGDAYTVAAKDIKRDWCLAGSMYDLVPDVDSSLTANRNCIDSLTGAKDSETDLANAHESIAMQLNQRGVYTEALTHAKEATTLNASDAFAFNAEADALNHLQRFNEAINAAKEALRLSDGKYGFMHFTLGSAYFGTENWELSKQSFEKAAELDPTDDAAAYNVAICSARMGYYNDAAHWYEEVLRRNPKRDDKDELRRRIDMLRR
jgi:tetratricopeptide (TPR) repeat protein